MESLKTLVEEPEKEEQPAEKRRTLLRK